MTPVSIFFSYAHEDDALRDQLRKQLRPWERENQIVCWCDRQIPPGSEWKSAIDERLNSADIILLLVSADFMDSDFCMEIEYPRAMERHREKSARVIPILLSPCGWKDSQYNTLQAYPKDLVPIECWDNPKTALYDVAKAIVAAAKLRVPSEQPELDSSENEAITDAEIERQYLEGQRYAVQTVRSEGIAYQEGISNPLLEEVFVPLSLSPNSFLPGFTPLDLERCWAKGLQIWDFLAKTDAVPQYRQLVLLAWGGYGKTTLLKHITLIYCTHQQTRYGLPPRIPVLLTLRRQGKILAQPKPPGLVDLIVQHHVPELPGAALQMPIAWVEARLRDGKILVMIDGFDEVAKLQRPAVAQWINRQMKQYPQTVFIVTSRPKAYQEQEGEPLELETLMWVQEFNAEQRRAFVERWYVCQERYSNGWRDTPDVEAVAIAAAQELLAQIEDQEELQLRDLAKNPLLLNMILRFHRQYPGADLPRRRAKLYEEICRLQLKDRPSARKLETLLNQCEAQTLLQMLALGMMQQRQKQLDRQVLVKQLTVYLQAQSETILATEFLEQVEQISELLIRREEEYEFAHLSFQEYLAAAQIAQQNQEPLLYEYFADDWWKLTILLYVSQIKDPTSLIRAAMEQGAIDLAYACLQMTSRQVDSGLKADVERELARLKEAVTDSRYAKLEELLKNQQWVDADNETYRLMITTVGKDEGQLFEDEELLNFPCKELRAIDGLWKHYSNGHFGFGVQKKIYVECGGKLDGKYPGTKVWETFGDRVGWREKGDWIGYSAITKEISLSVHQGKFPFLVLGWGLWSFVGFGFSSLAQRLVNCSTQQS
jgi:GUN4-like/TIR domain/NACHT domain